MKWLSQIGFSLAQVTSANIKWAGLMGFTVTRQEGVTAVMAAMFVYIWYFKVWWEKTKQWGSRERLYMYEIRNAF